MTLNAVFSAGQIPCLISDHLVRGGGSEYVTRKSALVSKDLVVAASGDEASACSVLDQIYNQFYDRPVSRGALFSCLGSIRQHTEYPCTIIGWLGRGRKKPLSFKWNSKHPANPEVDRGNIVDGSGDDVYKFVVPAFAPMPEREPVVNALSYCAECVGTLFINDVVHETLWRTCCGGGFEVYLRDPRTNAFRYADEIGCLYIPLRYRMRRGRLRYDVLPRFAYMKTSVDSVKIATGVLPCVSVRTIIIEPPRSMAVEETPRPRDNPLAAKLYACCFAAQDVRTGLILADVRTALGVDAEHFRFDFVPTKTPEIGLLLSPLAPIVIRNMARAATKRFQEAGMNLV